MGCAVTVLVVQRRVKICTNFRSSAHEFKKLLDETELVANALTVLGIENKKQWSNCA